MTSSKKHNRKNIVFLIAILGIAVLIALLIYGLEVGSGMPIGRYFANGKIQSYALRNYPEYDLEVCYPKFSSYGDWSDYSSKVVSRNDKNIHFTITYHRDGRITDSYCDIINNNLKQILEKEVDVKYVLSFDTSYNSINYQWPAVLDGVQIHISVEDIEPHIVSKIIIKCYEIIKNNGYQLIRYTFNFMSDESESQEFTFGKQLIIDYLKPEYINENLLLIIEEMQRNYNIYRYYENEEHFYYNGYYKDTGIHYEWRQLA